MKAIFHTEMGKKNFKKSLLNLESKLGTPNIFVIIYDVNSENVLLLQRLPSPPTRSPKSKTNCWFEQPQHPNLVTVSTR